MKAVRITHTVAILPVPIASCSPIYLSARTVPASKSGTKWQPVKLSLYWAQERNAKKFYLLQVARKKRAKKFEHCSELGVTMKKCKNTKHLKFLENSMTRPRSIVKTNQPTRKQTSHVQGFNNVLYAEKGDVAADQLTLAATWWTCLWKRPRVA